MDGGTMFRSQKSSLQTTNRLVLSVVLALAPSALLSLPAAAQSATPNVGANPDANLVNATLVDATPDNLITNSADAGTSPAPPDTNLVNPWGLAASPTGPWWVSDNGSGHATLYDGTGSPKPLVVSIPQWDGAPGGNPTGIVFNGTADFAIGGNATHFLFATEDGTIQGWSSDGSTVIAVNNFPGAVYKGLALASAGGANYLYVANFRNGTVDVFDKNYAPHSFGGSSFVDSTIPSGFAPFNVANIGGGKLAVTYAKQDAAKHDDVRGPGNGYITIFDTSGNILSRLPHPPYLNSPWAVVVA